MVDELPRSPKSGVQGELMDHAGQFSPRRGFSCVNRGDEEPSSQARVCLGREPQSLQSRPQSALHAVLEHGGAASGLRQECIARCGRRVHAGPDGRGAVLDAVSRQRCGNCFRPCPVMSEKTFTTGCVRYLRIRPPRDAGSVPRMRQHSYGRVNHSASIPSHLASK